MGDEAPGRGCSDLVLVVREALHPQFERRANDLVTCVSLPLLQALIADSILVPTLGGGSLPVRAHAPQCLQCLALCLPIIAACL